MPPRITAKRSCQRSPWPRLGVRLVDFVVAKSGCDMLRSENAAALLDRPSNWLALRPLPEPYITSSTACRAAVGGLFLCKSFSQDDVCCKNGARCGGRTMVYGRQRVHDSALSVTHAVQDTVSRVALELFKRLADDGPLLPTSPFACASACKLHVLATERNMMPHHSLQELPSLRCWPTGNEAPL